MSLNCSIVNRRIMGDCFCSESLQNGETIVEHNEGGEHHPVHLRCMLLWTERSLTCPTCRRPIQITAVNSLNQRALLLNAFVISQVLYSNMHRYGTTVSERGISAGIWHAAGYAVMRNARLRLLAEQIARRCLHHVISESSWQTLVSVGVGTTAAFIGRIVQCLDSGSIDPLENWENRFIGYTASAVAAITGMILANQYRESLSRSIVALKQRIRSWLGE